MLKSILVFFDGSKASRKAFKLGLDMATMYRAEMLIISVMPRIEAELMFERLQDYPVKELRDLCLTAAERGVPCRYRLDIGEFIEQVVRAAEDSKADIIIIGQCKVPLDQQTESETPIEAILSHARCPVTMIK